MSYDERSGIAKFFSSFGKALLYLLMLIVYGVIGGGLLVGGSFLVGSSTIWQDILSGDFSALLNFSSFFSNVNGIIGSILLVLGTLFLILGGFSAFLFTATRGPNYSSPIGFIQAFVVAFKILAGFLVLLLIFIGAWIGIGFIGNVTLTLIFGIIVYIVLVLVPLAMLFRIIDYISTRV